MKTRPESEPERQGEDFYDLWAAEWQLPRAKAEHRTAVFSAWLVIGALTIVLSVLLLLA